MRAQPTNHRSDAITVSPHDGENNTVSALYLVLHILRQSAAQAAAADRRDGP